MATQARDRAARSADDAPLNPAIRKRHDETYGAHHDASDPMKTVSVPKTPEGQFWPFVWAAAVVLSVLITIALLLL